MATIITEIFALPTSPYQGTGTVGIVITSGVPSYFRLSGVELDRIINVNWFPSNPGSVLFDTRQLILLNPNQGTFMIRVLNNYLSTTDRGGKLAFRLDNGDTLTYPVKTYGPVSVGPLWTAPTQGLITG